MQNTPVFHVLVFSLLAMSPLKGMAQAGDLAALQTIVDNYLAPAMTTEIDSMMKDYGDLNYGQTYHPDSPKLGAADSEGNADSNWDKMEYTAQTASQMIGYAQDLCANHAVAAQLKAKGVKFDEAKFESNRDKFCKLVHAAAELKHRYDKYQKIKQNGVTLVKRQHSQEHNFKGHHRTFGAGMELVYKPDIANTMKNGIHPDQTLIYNSWIKWSDDKPTPLNIIKRIREMRNDKAGNCDGFSFHIIDGKEVDGYLYLDVVAVTSSKLTIQNCAKVHYHKETRSHKFPEVSMNAPFGYLYEVEQMKDSAKQKLKDKVKDKVTSMIGANKQMIDLMKKLKDLAG